MASVQLMKFLWKYIDSLYATTCAQYIKFFFFSIINIKILALSIYSYIEILYITIKKDIFFIFNKSVFLYFIVINKFILHVPFINIIYELFFISFYRHKFKSISCHMNTIKFKFSMILLNLLQIISRKFY